MFSIFIKIILILPSIATKTNNIDIKSWRSAQTFDGFGAVSGGGATSKLLFTYFSEKSDRKQVLESLFNKDNGLQLLKVEMGGDDQSTEGTESSHESEKGKISKNNYEFQLISEVREINPTIPICVLPWAFPGWIGNTPYDNVTETAEYVVNWLKIGRDTWNFDTFCVGVWNERNFSESYVKELRKILNLNGFNETLIVAGEGFRMDDSYSRLLDKRFINEYDIIGVHYPGGRIPENVQKSGKVIWASEDYSTDNRDTGEGCMARTMNWNFINGNITGMISWHLMSAFYPQLPWYRCGLARIDENKFQTEKAFHVLKYITSHVKRGWKILRESSGRFDGGGTYVTYTNGKDSTIFVETMSYKKSLCEYSSPRPYHVKPSQLIRFKFSEIPSFQGLNMSLNFGPSKFFSKSVNSTITILLPVNSFGILTTLPVSTPKRVTIKTPLVPLNYHDDFENYEFDEEPKFWMPQKGSWVVRNGRAVQKVTRPSISWCTSHIRTPYAVMAYRKKNSILNAEVNIPKHSTAKSIILGIRSNCSGCDIEVINCRGIFVEIEFSNKKVTIFSDFVDRSIIAEFKARRKVEFGKFYKFSIHLLDSHLFIKFGNHHVMTSVEIPEEQLNKTNNDTLFVIGTGNFGISEWDNISTDYFH
ncbi:Putative galactocerebrosidase [Caenorhabditis elegans]|uniref:Putative galactocerebrosidase n=1 Tax=Caenorhabditis elegans TaxID=6239 RepID=GALC_CAEEL|nr:Putative galactocerebrosidase [Caenorhabditis elegans]Q95QT2.3 RecName: Full=Putative galactocerebrosidase; Short=GALCERase; AltName: Full=Galactocerebroside beta-galactosidase; AltName: Full=Galactosylceramidase; AltName: Full=Galactosylceramide beta-galactosidase; Flags: Precursor [Caenorhabditis elegans]CCD66013.2 Putative galactocerebrosidase [Caenorhabditis elegans]|eukprot:NP_498726.3 Putative galactocerebrosidase [Caenorhabditis elegans]